MTLFFVSDNVNKKAKGLHVPRSFLLFGCGLAFVILVFSAISFVNFSAFVANRFQYFNEVLDAKALNGELSFVRRLAGKMDSDMSRIFHFDDKIRMLYGLEVVNKDVREVGIGGPDFSSRAARVITLFDDRKNKEMKELKNRLDKLLRQAELETGSIRETYHKVIQTQKQLRRYPSVLPCFGRITSGFGYRVHPIEHQFIYHQGVDIANRPWTPVYATADGVVDLTDYSTGYGNLIAVEHGFGFKTLYGHLQTYAVRPRQFVMRGDLLGYIGSSGITTGPHLHYEIRRNGKAIDPLDCIYPVSAVIE